MKSWRKAMILAVVTEGATIAWFVAHRGSNNDLPTLLVILHYPAMCLTFIGAPWLLAVLIETAMWMVVWFLLVRVFATGEDELTRITFIGTDSEKKKL